MSLLALALWSPQDSSQFKPLLPLEHTGSYPRLSHPHVFGLSCSGPGFQGVSPTIVVAPNSESLSLNAHPRPDRQDQRSDILLGCTGM